VTGSSFDLTSFVPKSGGGGQAEPEYSWSQKCDAASARTFFAVLQKTGWKIKDVNGAFFAGPDTLASESMCRR
jgi:hypothetical protein